MKGWPALWTLAAWAAALAPLGALPSEQQPSLEVARQLVAEGKWSQAEAAFSELQRRGLLSQGALDDAAEASRRLNHWERVVALYRLFPLNAEQRLKLYEACLRAGRQEEAEGELKALREQRPEDEQLVHLLAFLYLSQNRAREAVLLYQSYLSRHPKAFESSINLALVHFSLEETDAALGLLGQALQAGRGEANKYLHRQMVRNMSGMPPGEIARLIEDIRRELGLAAQGADTFRMLAEEYRNLNRYAQAIEAYETYLGQKQGDDPESRFALARLYFLQGNDSKASAALAPLLQGSSAQADQARLFAAELAVKGSDFEKAGRLLGQLPARYASQGIFQYLSARIALDRGETERARQLLEQVTQSHPEIAEAFLHLGQIYMRLGRRQEGQRLLAEFKQRSQQ